MNSHHIVIEEGQTPSFQDFAVLMNKTELLLNDYAIRNTALDKLSPKEIEKLSLAIIQRACEGTNFDPMNVYLVEPQRFPDIIAQKNYGVEVKCTQKNHWTSTGSSIIESTRINGVKRIYMLFGKLGGKPASFRCRPYEQVLSGITVTHSPRYLIDMNLSLGDSIFDKMGISYDELRTSTDSIAKVRHYYKSKMKSNKEMPWWLSDDQETESLTAGISLRTWDALSAVEKDIVFPLLLLLFPTEIICKDYRKIALWSATTISLLLHNARDFFSAGGKGKYIRTSKGETLELEKPVPHTYIHFVNNAEVQKQILYKQDFLNRAIPFLEELNSQLITESRKPQYIYKRWVEQVSSLLEDIPFYDWITGNIKILV